MKTTRIAALGLVALASVGIAVGSAAIANAQTASSTITMRVQNDTEQTIYLQGADNPDGTWTQQPPQALAPHMGAVVTAVGHEPGGFGVDAVYNLPDNSGTVVFAANGYADGTNLDGTRVTGPNAGSYHLGAYMESFYPNLVSGYHLDAIGQ